MDQMMDFSLVGDTIETSGEGMELFRSSFPKWALDEEVLESANMRPFEQATHIGTSQYEGIRKCSHEHVAYIC